MRETDKKKSIPNNSHRKRSNRGNRKEQKVQENERNKLNAKEAESGSLDDGPESTVLASDSNAGTESTEVYENLVIHYVDDMDRPEGTAADLKSGQMAARENKDEVEDHSSDLEKDSKQGKEDESDCETAKDSVSSQGEAQAIEDDKIERVSRVPKVLAKKDSAESSPRSSRVRTDRREASKLQNNVSNNASKRSAKSNRESSKVNSKGISENKSTGMKVPPKPSSETSEGVDDKPIEEIKEIEVLDEALNSAHSLGSDDEMVDAEENGFEEDREIFNQRMEEMEQRIEKLEQELREIAALEISLYSVVPEHGSSAHKVHTPARRLSRLYIHACKHWTQDKRATVARNTASGLVLIAKSCGNDVPRLTFWLSNTIVLREIIAQAFGNSHHLSPVAKVVESNGGVKKSEGKSLSLKWKGSSGSKQVKKLGFMQVVDDWQETTTFTTALEKIESWIFSRIVESVWWQVKGCI
uniref:Uncharacterized protein n=1 Tax=Nelumbo nucifera TaxID=4432 RepID=A0A822ZF14_NELNU|nr:TPA_asm: hypothetical protein HUJ06_000571 [Nelumbo nucifera]